LDDRNLKVRWHFPIIPALERQRQENSEFKASLDEIARSYLKKIVIK
jgi:DNA-binding HxlR family transcriptional regulator